MELEKLKKDQEKIGQKKMDIAVKEIVKKSNMENCSEERVKQMLVVLNTNLFDNSVFMAEFLKGVQSLGVGYRVGDGGSDGGEACSVIGDAGSVRWVRVLKERTVDEDAQIVEREGMENEKNFLVVLSAQEFMGLVHRSKEVFTQSECV